MGRKKGRDISGWIVIDKPAGVTSTAVVSKLRWALDAKKAGHAGTLDPAATGVLAVAHHIAHEEGPAYAGQHDDADGPRGQGRQREAETALGHSGSDTLADLSQRLGHRIYMASGALTPSRSRPLRSTWLTARSRARRERVRAVSSASST